jgi:predicted TIM-barrel enzyme
MSRFERKAILARLQAMKRAGVPIIGGGAGTGLSAKCEYILRAAKHCHGASSMERLPTEKAMTEHTRKFKAIAFG